MRYESAGPVSRSTMTVMLRGKLHSCEWVLNFWGQRVDLEVTRVPPLQHVSHLACFSGPERVVVQVYRHPDVGSACRWRREGS